MRVGVASADLRFPLHPGVCQGVQGLGAGVRSVPEADFEERVRVEGIDFSGAEIVECGASEDF